MKKKVTQKKFRFEAALERFSSGMRACFIHFPFDVQEIFGTKGHVRMTGTVNGIPVERALIPRGDGTHYVLIPLAFRRKARLREGDKVLVELQPHARPNEVQVPEELSAALEMEPGIFEKFNGLPTGVRRNMAYWINSGKQAETRIRRALEILRRLQNGEPGFGMRPGKR